MNEYFEYQKKNIETLQSDGFNLLNYDEESVFIFEEEYLECCPQGVCRHSCCKVTAYTPCAPGG